jgi:flagellar motor switch protein FliN
MSKDPKANEMNNAEPVEEPRDEKESADVKIDDSGAKDEVPEHKVELTVVDGGASRNSPEPATEVKAARFSPLPAGGASGEHSGMEMLLDVKLDLSVELGRTVIPVRGVLQLGPGAVVELEKPAGEPVEIYVNGKLIAKGEVVVVDENFGVRVTEIVSRAA